MKITRTGIVVFAFAFSNQTNISSRMGKKMNSAVYVKVLSEPMNFPPSVSPSKEMGDHTN